MVENSLLTAGVRAMGLKFEGEDGSCMAELFQMSLMTTVFHCIGIMVSTRIELNRSRKALWRDGHFLEILYDIWSK